MRQSWPRLAPSLVLVIAALAAVSVVFGVDSPLRAVATLTFALVGPGLVVMRLVRLPSIPMEVALAVPVSLSIDALIAAGVLYLGRWSAEVVLALVIIFAVALATRQVFGPIGDGEALPRSREGTHGVESPWAEPQQPAKVTAKERGA